MHPGLPAALPESDPAPRAGPDTSGASPGHRSLGAQGDARDLRATARDSHFGGLTPPVASGRTRETSLDPNTKALPLRPPLLPSGGSCPGRKRTPRGRLPRWSPIADRTHLPPPTPSLTWCLSIIVVLRRLRQGDRGFKVSLGYTANNKGNLQTRLVCLYSGLQVSRLQSLQRKVGDPEFLPLWGF